ncbi:MAG TPA: hypothetical protein VLI94_08525, partial [Solirubrobacterales bacterium]|nr:hypothetical protein [Solirubrobacterales bacterium]
MSAAQAQIAFRAGTYPATLHASSALGNEVLKTEAGTVECSGSHHDELSEASTTLSLNPTYTSCKAFGFATATVTTSGCAYVLHLGEQ